MNAHPALVEGLLLAVELFVVGLYAGIHWFNYLGGLPALRDLERAETFVDFWQNVDRYMGARMRIFGPAVLVSCILPMLWFAAERNWWVAGGEMVVLALLLADVATAIVGNVPINAAIQSWRLDAIPESWRDVRGALLRYFRLRGALSLATTLPRAGHDGQVGDANRAVLAGEGRRLATALLLGEAADPVIARIVDGDLTPEFDSQAPRAGKERIAHRVLRPRCAGLAQLVRPPVA